MASLNSNQAFNGIAKLKNNAHLSKGAINSNSNIRRNALASKIEGVFKYNNDFSLEDGRITKAYFDRLQMVELGTFVMSLVGIGLSILQYDLEFDDNEHEEWSVLILYVIFISSILLVIMTITRYILKLEFRDKRNGTTNKSTVWETGEWKQMLAECIFVFIHPSPFFLGIKIETNTSYDKVRIYYHVNDILNIIVFLRLIVIIRVVLLHTYWYSNRAQRLCEMYDCESGYMFALKCLMRKSPERIVMMGLIISIPCFGYLLRICERPIVRTISDPSQWNFDSYLDCMWNVIITITTVGYGDYYAKTLLGRIVIFICSIWGAFVVSLMVVALTNILEMGPLEQKAYHVLRRLTTRDKMRNEAAHVLTRLVKVKLKAKKYQYISSGKISEIKDHLKKFKTLSRTYRELGNSETGFEEVGRQFDFLKNQVHDVMKQTNYLMETNKLLMDVLGVDKGAIEKLKRQLVSGNLPTNSIRMETKFERKKTTRNQVAESINLPTFSEGEFNEINFEKTSEKNIPKIRLNI